MKNAKKLIQRHVLNALRSSDIHNVQVKAVADAAGVSRSTFYLYYDSAYAVLQDIEDEFFEGLETVNASFWSYPLRREYMSRPHPILLNILRYLQDNREISNVLRGPHGDIMFQIRCRKTLQKSLFPEELMRAYYPEDTELHVAYLMGGHLEVIQNWMSHDCPIPAEKFTVKIYQLMFSDLFSK